MRFSDKILGRIPIILETHYLIPGHKGERETPWLKRTAISFHSQTRIQLPEDYGGILDWSSRSEESSNEYISWSARSSAKEGYFLIDFSAKKHHEDLTTQEFPRLRKQSKSALRVFDIPLEIIQDFTPETALSHFSK